VARISAQDGGVINDDLALSIGVGTSYCNGAGSCSSETVDSIDRPLRAYAGALLMSQHLVGELQTVPVSPAVLSA
jgi:hypothetical protein